MKKSLLFAVAGVCFLAGGCGKKTTVADQIDKWNATQDVFTENFNTVKVDGVDVTLPTTTAKLKELGFTTDTDEDMDITEFQYYNVLYKGSKGAEFYVMVNGDTIGTANATVLQWNNQLSTDGKMEFVNGITLDSKEDLVNETLDNFMGNKMDVDYYTYMDSDLNVGMNVHYYNNKIESITVYCDKDPAGMDHTVKYVVPLDEETNSATEVSEEFVDASPSDAKE